MDKTISAFPAAEDDDLMLCHADGVAYQRDMSRSVVYDETYFDKCGSYRGTPIAKAINAGRVAIVNRWAGAQGDVIDIGVGAGEFIVSRGAAVTRGHDINPKAAQWLKERGLWVADLSGAGAFTFWDVIEHVPEPDHYFDQMKPGALVFFSLPIFGGLREIRASKHYRPDEHYYYWTEAGFIAWMKVKGFELLEMQDFETRAGRDSILSFAFRRSF